MRPGRIDDFLGNPQFCADEKSVGFAGDADAQLIGWHQAVHIKLTAGIDHAGRLQSIDFELGIMGRGHEQRSLAAQPFQNADSQCRALRRVGTGSKLVQQNQSSRTGQFQNPGNTLHVAGESGKTLLDALLVADVHKILFKAADLAALVGRNQKSVLRHGVQQASRFQGYRFAAGVGAGDHEGIVVIPQLNIDRNHLFLVDQRVAGTFDGKAVGIIYLRHKGVLLHGQACFGKQQIDLEHRLVAVGELGFHLGNLGGKGRQNSGDFLLLLSTQLHDLGVGFHNGGRLNKNRRAGGGHVMDHAADLAAVFCPDRHDVTAVSQRDDRILQEFIGGRVLYDVVQFGTDRVLGGADFTSKFPQGGAGGVCHLLRRNNRIGDLALQNRFGMQRIKQIIHRQHVVIGHAVPLGQASKIAQGSGNFQQFSHGQDAALDCVGRYAADVRHRAEARTSVFDIQ